MKDLKDKVAVITGGGSGIGLAIAEKLNQAGAKIVLFGRNKQKLEQAKMRLSHAHCIAGDVTKIQDLDTLFAETKKVFGTVDVLVASAGVAEVKHVSEVDEAFFDWIVDINYKGLFFTVQRSLPFLNSGASVILISSAAAHIGWPAHSVYSSTKAAVSYLARSLSGDLVDRGIRVNALSPGFTATPMLADIPSEVVEAVNGCIPIGRFAKPKEIANGAYFLASSQSSYITGAEIVVDGGLSSSYPFK